jgi:hypothetical protein
MPDELTEGRKLTDDQKGLLDRKMRKILSTIARELAFDQNP